MKPAGIILRVGIDSSTGGVYAPVYNDGSFEFIPFPESRKMAFRTNEELLSLGLTLKRYSDIHSRKFPDKFLSDLLPYEFANRYPHNDPNFQYHTYGDFWKDNSGGRLPKSWKNIDMERETHPVLFVSTLADYEYEVYSNKELNSQFRKWQNSNKGIYLIGFLIPKVIIDISDYDDWYDAIDSNREFKDGIINNFHFFRETDSPVIVLGKSKLLDHAYLLKSRDKITDLGIQLGVKSKGDVIRQKYLYDLQDLDSLIEA